MSSISEVASRLLEAGAEHPHLDHLAEIALLREQPTNALLGMRRKWEGDQEFSRSEWELLARYAETGCEQHGFSSDSGLPSRESFAQVLEAFLAVWSLLSGANRRNSLNSHRWRQVCQLGKLHCGRLVAANRPSASRGDFDTERGIFNTRLRLGRRDFGLSRQVHKGVM
jgi:hypothetical protein